MTGFGPPQPASVESGALRQIDSSTKTFVNKDFVKNMAWLNQSVDTLSAYTQKLQAGVDSANKNVVDQIQGVIADIFVLIAGGEPTGIDLGDLKYILQAIGSLFGINPNTPFPLNLIEAVGHMFDQFIVPLPQFTDVIFDAILAWAVSLGFSEEAVDAIREFDDAVVDLYHGIDDTFDVIGDMFTAIFKAFGLGTGGINLSGLEGFWAAISSFLDNILEGPNELLMNVLSNIVVFIFKSLTWLVKFINPSNLLGSTGMRFIGPQLVPDVSGSTVDWTVGSNINTGWVFDSTVTHTSADQINTGINTGWWTVPHYTTDTSPGSFKTIGNGVAKRVLTQEITPTIPGKSYFLSGYIKWSSIPVNEDTVGPCLVFYSGATEVTQTNVNLPQGHGATGDWVKISQIIVAPQNVDGFKIGCRITPSFNSGTVWIDDISCTGEQARGAGIAQGILDFPRNLVSGIIDYIDGIVTFFFGENNILSKVLASIIPGLDATVITTGKFAQDMIDGLDSAIQAIWDGINGVITDLGQLIHDLWYDPIGTIGQIGQNMVEGLSTALTNLGNGISDLVSDLGQLLYDLWNDPVKVIANLLASMIPGLDASKIISGQLAQDMVNGLTTALTDLANGVNSALTNLGQLLYDLWHNPIEVIANLAAVMIPGLDASKITSGQYAMEMVAGLNDALTNLGNWVQDVIDAVIGGLTGIPIVGGVIQGIIDGIESLFNGLFGQPAPAATLAAQAVPALDASKIQTGQVAADRIAALDAAKIGTGQFGTARIADNAIVDAKISDLSGTKINTGTVAATYVGALDASKIQSGQFQNAQIASGLDAGKLTAGTLPIARVADGAVTNTKIASGVDAGKLTTGTLPIDRVADNAITIAKINDLSGSKINAGSVAANYIAALDGSKIKFGTVDVTRLPTTTIGAQLLPSSTAGAQISRTSTTNKNAISGRNIFENGFFDTEDVTSPNVEIINGNQFKVTAKGWYQVEISVRLNPELGFAWGLCPLLYRTRQSSPYDLVPYKSGTDSFAIWLLGAYYCSRYAQSTWSVYLPAGHSVAAGYDCSGASVNLFDADTTGVETYFSIVLLNKDYN